MNNNCYFIISLLRRFYKSNFHCLVEIICLSRYNTYNMKNSGIEIELKFALFEQPEVFLKRFSNPGKRTYQKTVMFDNSQGLMQKTNGRVRLRQDGEAVTLSYKLPLPSDTVKKEIEWETRVDSWEIGENLLKAMRFDETTSYEKYRTSFDYSG